MADERIRVAIMGQGRSGYSIHATTFQQLVSEKFVVVAVADQLPERRKQAEDEMGCVTYDDWRALLAAGGFELVVNSLPSPLHLDASIAAFKAGYHVASGAAGPRGDTNYKIARDGHKTR
jgi:predicted dehydrogenase